MMPRNDPDCETNNKTNRSHEGIVIESSHIWEIKSIIRMWKVTLREDPLHMIKKDADLHSTRIVSSSCSLSELFPSVLGSHAVWTPFSEGGRTARIAFADFVARQLGDAMASTHLGEFTIRWALLSTTTMKKAGERGRQANSSVVPFILERTDIRCTSNDELHIGLRLFLHSKDPTMKTDDDLDPLLRNSTLKYLSDLFESKDFTRSMMNHVATAVLQDRLREQLKQRKAVAFVANGAVLPRKSGASHAPMTSPPAVPFEAPANSKMNGTLEISIGWLRPFLPELPSSSTGDDDNILRLNGLLVPEGVSLIVGGGYHGKSTLLRTIACGVYNKIPGDGREFSVTVTEAVTVRAEDGRYVNKCNISAFISNLPTLPGASALVDTTLFSTNEASGSTSQAANVVEAIEMGCSALLVDEDVSAANFMARDGRMRSLVMDESITPLLYRVNGLYATHGISSIVVVGGVGDWLDVPDAVILMDKYTCRDATEKARSVSRQFSHGHVQYGGRGVVHRLDWEKTGTPIPRRPTDRFLKTIGHDQTGVALIEGSHSISLYHANESSLEHHYHDDDEEDRLVDMSKCEQLMGKKSQLYGCGLCLVWLLEESCRYPEVGLKELLEKMDHSMDETDFACLVLGGDTHGATLRQDALLASIGNAYRPRRFEVGQALTRLRGTELENISIEEDDEEKTRLIEEERKKQELLDLWNARRKK